MSVMPTTSKIEQLALELPVSERASLASVLLRSLPEILIDEDNGLAEAERSREEMNADPEIGISPEELRYRVSKRFEI